MANDNIPTIGFWVGAGPKQISLTVMDPNQVQNQTVFSDFPDTTMALPMLNVNEKTGKFTWNYDPNKNIISLREWLFSLLKDSDGNKFRQASVEIPVDFIQQNIGKKDGRPYKSVNFKRGDQAAAQLVSFVQQITKTLAVKTDSGAQVASQATDMMSKVSFG